jgi:hypothetical protein
MSAYVKVLGSLVLKYPYTFEDLQGENPYTNFPNPNDIPALYVGTEDQIASGAEIVSVQQAIVPVCDANKQRLIPWALPQQQDSVWVISYDVEDMSQEEILANTSAIAAVVQAKINAVLLETAWTVEAGSNLTAEKVQEWVEYRDAVSKVPQQPNFPLEYTYPDKPLYP